MFLLIVYDVSEKRVVKVNRYLKQYLVWIQNSVFEGQVSDSMLEAIKAGLKDIVDNEEDTVYFFTVRNPNHIRKEIMGVEKGFPSRII